ncbi:hypothetical protein [Micromonospora sp. WMMD998]|uniref:hypothetical protein n=1 Tax=Micromonospora sp. WMMD998 TaxID=3016092 RepID=UPI00249ABD9C|nr:hypothetical protein [Micromonospora sp. WMMD998]WFE39430.1 hypothetical protein O7619_13755 [Micromonospora sp. WMMD998]
MDAARLDQETVERLLAGTSGGPESAAPRALVRLLDTVRTVPGSGELDGEAAAVAAYRAARATTPIVGRFTAGLLGAKLAVATLAATLTGGVALAAVTGNLPGGIGVDAPPATPGTSAAPTTGTTPTTVPMPTAATTRTAHPSHPAGTGPTATAADPSAPAGLCVAYRAVAEGERGRALDAPAFAGLVAAAGGRDRVPGYCAGLLAGAGPPAPAGPPSGAGRTGHRTSRPAEPPTGGAPTPDAAGPPTDAGTGAAGPVPSAARSSAGTRSDAAGPPDSPNPTLERPAAP